MSKSLITYLICYDEQRRFIDDIKKRFDDIARYKVMSFNSQEEFLKSFKDIGIKKSCRIALLGVNDNQDNNLSVKQLVEHIKNDGLSNGIILLGPADKSTTIEEMISDDIYAYIPMNANTVLRVHNNVKKLISEHSIGVFETRRNVSLTVLSVFLLISLVFLVFSYFAFPKYF